MAPQSFHSCVAICPATTGAIKKALSDIFHSRPFIVSVSSPIELQQRRPSLQIFTGSNSRGQGTRAKPQLENSACASSSLALPLPLCLCSLALPSTLFSILLFCVPDSLPSLCCPPHSVCTHIVPALCGPLYDKYIPKEIYTQI